MPETVVERLVWLRLRRAGLPLLIFSHETCDTHKKKCDEYPSAHDLKPAEAR
jgi:hypothetical protein